MLRPRILALTFAFAAVLCALCLQEAESQSPLRRVTNTTNEGININPSISGDGRILGFESTEDIAGAGGPEHFRAIRANISVDPTTFFQIGATRAVAPAISQDGSRIAFASKDNPLGTNADGNSEIFVFNGSNLVQITNTSPGDIANRVVNGNFQPSISDDGRYIPFSSNRDLASQNSDGNLEIFVFDATANTFAQLTNSSGTVGCSDAKISGDGVRVAFIRDTGATPSARRDLMIQNRASGPATVLASQVQTLLMTYGRAISDDGARVVYSGETAVNSSQVFFYDGRGGNINRQVTTLGTRVTEVPLHPTISGDGRRISFAARRAVTGFTNSDSSVELYTYDIPTTTFARVTNVTASEADCFDGSSLICEVVSSLNDDGSTVAFNFPRTLSGAVTAGLENKSEIYVTATVARPPSGALTSILNQASLGHEPSPVKAVAPDSIAAAFGSALANTTQQSQRQPDGNFPTNVAGTTVTVNGRSAQIFFVSPGRVHFLVPAQTEIGTAEVVITNADGFESRGSVPILRAAPGIFTKSGDGIGEGMIFNADTLQEGPFDPSGGNLRLLIFSTGARNALVTTVNIGGRVVNAESVVASPDMRGLDEVRVIVPSDLRGTGAVNLSIQSDGRDSNPVTVTFTGDPSRAVFINEVLADPPDGIAGDANRDGTRDGTQDEFVELVNGAATELINIGGWTVRTRATGSMTENTRFTFASGTSLPAGNAIVVFGGGNANFNPNDNAFGCAQVVKATTATGLSLTNGGLTVLIRDAAGNIIAEFPYGGSTSLEGDNNQSLTRSPDVTGAFVQHTAAAGANGRRYSPGLKVDGTPFGNCASILTSVTIAPPSATITVGQTQQFTAQAFDQFGRVMTGVTISFTSDNTSVATVDSVSMNSMTGVATATVGSHNPGTAHITASATDGSNTVNSSQATLTVTGPSLSINDVSLNEGDSGTTIFSFTVSLSTPAPVPVTFNIATQDNTATVADSDYVARALTAQSIPAGQQTYTFDVTVNGDLAIEQTETFFVNVTNVSGASVGDAQGLGTIVTDDIPLLSVNDVSQVEGNSGATIFTFTVTSNRVAPAGGITFDIATADGTAQDDNPASEDNDYVARSLTSQTIPAGQQTYTFDVTVNGDTLVEANEIFTVNISNVSANAAVGDGQGVGTIQNDDTALLVISQVYPGGGLSGATFTNDFIELYNRGATTVDFSITPYSVQFLSTGGSTWVKTDLTSGTILPGRYFLIRGASGGAVGAALPAFDETGSINLTSTTPGKVALMSGTSLLTGSCPGDDGSTPFNPLNAAISDFVGYLGTAGTANHCYEGSGPAPFTSGNNTIADFRKAGGCVDTNDNGADFFTASPNPRNSASPAGTCQPEIIINDPAAVIEGTSITFTVSLSAASSQTITVNYATADNTATSPADYGSTGGLLTFNPGELSKPITVTTSNDLIDEATENFFVNLSGATNAVLLDGQGQGTINDNNPTPSLSINDLSIAEGDTGTTAFTFTVSLSAASGQTVTVNYATADNTATAGIDYQSTSGLLTFIPGDTAETLTVLVNGDTTFEPNETFFVNLNVPANASISDAQGQGTITNDDAAPPTPTLFIDDLSTITEGNSGTSVVTFTVTLSPSSVNPVTVDYITANVTASDTSDYVATSGQLSFAPGETSKPINVTINGDTLVEPDETFRINLSNATGGASIAAPGFGTGTIKNDDTADLVISQTYPGGGLTGATFTHDFIELFNQGTTTVNFAVTPYSVQFLSTSASTWAKTDLTSGTLAPGRYFLIQGTSGANGVALPTPDATGSLNLTSTTAGKVALVVGGTLLVNNCPGDDLSAPFNPVDGTIVDFVGYGGTAATANHCYEGSGPAPYTLSNNTTADFRKLGGCQDTNDNTADFLVATPSPRNSSSPINDCAAADLAITKTDSPDPVVTGSDVTYTITVSNNGPATAQSVVVTDNLPGNVTFVSCASTGIGVCGGSGNNRTVTFSSLAAGGSETITMVATANGPAGTPISNTTTITSSTTDSNSGNNSATATTDVNNPTFADLSILKTDSPDPVSPTATLTYTLSVTNNGPDTAQSVVVTDTLPSEVTFVDCSSDQGGVCGGTANNRTIAFSSLANGVTATITIHVTVNGNVTAGTVISNTAAVGSATADSTPGNNSDSEDTTVAELNAGDLLISEFRTRGPSGASDEFVEIYNPTSSTLVIGGIKIRASNVSGVISDRVTITAGTTLGSGCHYLVAHSTAYSGVVAANQTYGIGITDDGGIAITRANGTTIIDQVGMSAASAYKEGTPLAQLPLNVEQSYERKPGGAFGNGTDTNNNSADFVLNASSSNPQNSSSGCINVNAADVAITKTDSPDPVFTGSNVTYTLTVTNNGPAAAQSVVVTDNLPGNVTFVSCNSTGAGVCGGTGNNRTVTFTSLAAGASETITLVATATGASGTTITNTATVTSSTTDSNAANNSATATTDVTAPVPPDLTIGNVTQVETNSLTTTFTFTVQLSSPAQAGGVSFTVNTADGTTNPANSGSDYVAIVNGSGSIAQNDSSTTVSVTVNGDTDVELNETFFVNLTAVSGATVSDGQGLGTITNDDAVAGSADLSITKTDAPDPVAIGNDITYTITVTNGGPDAAANVALSDTVPTNTTFRSIAAPVGWTCPTQPAVGGTGAISCTNANFGVGSAVFTLVVRVGTAVSDGTIITNTASVSSTTADSNPGNESAMQTTTVKQPVLVISQVYGGGGNSTAFYRYDFIEIFNKGTTTVDFSVTPYAVHYAGVGSSFGSTNKTDINTGTLAPGQYLLIQEASGANTAAANLPTPDFIGTIAMGATSGKVALTLGTAVLASTSCPGDDLVNPFNPNSSAIVDFVGYGSTAGNAGHCYEGTGPTAAPANNTSVVRKAAGCQDTNVNSGDFDVSAAPPTPRNKLTTPAPCP